LKIAGIAGIAVAEEGTQRMAKRIHKAWGSPTKTKAILDKVCIRGACFCGYCGAIVPKKKMTVDHITPKCKGGTNDIENLMPCCGDCNRDKADMSLDQFREMRGNQFFYFEIFDKPFEEPSA
jgi:5-methylcytosine-specific restriction endonuclease McrA